MSAPANLLTIFNEHFSEFLNDIQSVFPDDVDVATAKNSLLAIRKANPKLLMLIWKSYIVAPYGEQIQQGNIDFFINKDYSQDFAKADNSAKIMEAINRLRAPVKNMSPDNQAKTMKYLQNLCKIALMYEP